MGKSAGIFHAFCMFFPFFPLCKLIQGVNGKFGGDFPYYAMQSVRKVRSGGGMSPWGAVRQESPQWRRHESVRSSPSGKSAVAAWVREEQSVRKVRSGGMSPSESPQLWRHNPALQGCDMKSLIWLLILFLINENRSLTCRVADSFLLRHTSPVTAGCEPGGQCSPHAARRGRENREADSTLAASQAGWELRRTICVTYVNCLNCRYFRWAKGADRLRPKGEGYGAG